MRLLLVSTYELGHQPLHVASPAAALRAGGHQVVMKDAAVDSLDDEAFADVDAMAVSVPMHTAARLAQNVISRARSVRPGLPVALYGLYAGEGTSDGVSARFVGEYEPDLVAWADAGCPQSGLRISLGTGRFRPPARDDLPSFERYAALDIGGELRLAGYVEASHGCRHRCRHCPIPAVYDGRYRIVDAETVLADIASQVEAGVLHMTWGDPDFLNGPPHAIRLLEEAHRRHPHVTHDLTIKVEHLRRHSNLLPLLAASGVVFIVSAFETTDDRTLALLDKGHTAEDMRVVVDEVRRYGIEIHPSWMPFVPWTTPDDVVDIFRFLAANDLLGSTDPVQMSIRLLIPRDSLMLDLEEVSSVVDGYDSELLTYRWSSFDPRSDVLQQRLATIAEHGSISDADPVETLRAMWAESCLVAGIDPSEAHEPYAVTRGRPRLTESWFCCAEPTTAQAARLI